MSTCRIERKRAHDREAQRASRAKTKAYIAHLEKTVTDLSESSGDNRANYLATHASKQAQDIDSLKGLVSKIRTLVQDATKSDQSPSNGASSLKRESTADSVQGEGSSSNATAEPYSAATNWDSPTSEDNWSGEIQKPAEQKETHAVARKMSTARSLNIMGTNILCEDVEDCSYFTRLNQAIASVEQTPDNLSSIEEDQDIIIRAVVSGWDAAERLHHFDIVWRFLRAFDEGLWYRAGPVERLAHFWQMRSTMLHKIQPKNQMRRAAAPFMSPTLAQQARSYPPVVDYFGWPQVRNHLIKQGITRCSGKSTIAFAESFRFVWPFELRDAYKVNRSTGLYSLSEGFLKSYNDLSCFRMLHHNLIPYYVHPTLAKAAPLHSFDNIDRNDDSDGSEDEDMSGLNTTQTHILIPSTEGLVSDVMVADWMSHFGMETSSDTQYMDAFSMAHEAALSQWPTI